MNIVHFLFPQSTCSTLVPFSSPPHLVVVVASERLLSELLDEQFVELKMLYVVVVVVVV